MPLTLAVDQIQPASASYVSWEGVPTGMPLAINVISYSTRTALSTNAASGSIAAFGEYFTKLRSDTVLRATCTVFGAGFYSGNCGVGLVLDYGTANERWDYGLAYQYDGAWVSSQQTTILMGHSQWTGVSAGRHIMSFGWKPADGGAGNKPFNYICPNSSDDARNNQMVSRIVVYEVYP
jgi:hypothetical protein